MDSSQSIVHEAGEMAQYVLKSSCCSCKDSFPALTSSHSKTTYNSSSKGPDAFFWSLQILHIMHMHTLRYTQMHQSIKVSSLIYPLMYLFVAIAAWMKMPHRLIGAVTIGRYGLVGVDVADIAGNSESQGGRL